MSRKSYQSANVKSVLSVYIISSLQSNSNKVISDVSMIFMADQYAPVHSSREIFQIFVSRYSKNALPGSVFLDFLVKHFPNCLAFITKDSSSRMIFKQFIYSNKKICFVISFWELQMDLSWKNSASSTDGITQSSVNYLRKIKSEYYPDLSTQLRIHWRISTILITSKKSVWSNDFWHVKVYIFWRCIKHTIHWAKA